MKVLLSLGNGLLTITQDNHELSININAEGELGGGAAAGVIRAGGKGFVALEEDQALKISEAFINSKLPAAIEPVAEVVEGIVNKTIASIE